MQPQPNRQRHKPLLTKRPCAPSWRQLRKKRQRPKLQPQMSQLNPWRQKKVLSLKQPLKPSPHQKKLWSPRLPLMHRQSLCLRQSLHPRQL